MVTIQGIKPSDFYDTNKDKTLLNWYCYELALAFETELKMYADDPSFKKWLKKPIVRPLTIELTNQLKHTIVTRNLSTATTLVVRADYIEKHVQNLPKNNMSELISSLNDIVSEQADACKHCPTRCLKNKKVRCLMFDDPLYSKPLSGIGKDIGTDTRNEDTGSVHLNDADSVDDADSFDNDENMANALFMHAAEQIITEFLAIKRKKVKEQTLKTYNRVMVSLSLYIANRYNDFVSSAEELRFISSKTPPLNFLSPFLIRYMNDTEHIFNYFCRAITVMKQVPSVMAGFIDFMVSKGVLDESAAIALNYGVEKIRDEITRKLNSTKVNSIAEAMRIINMPDIVQCIKTILSGDGTADTLNRNIRRQIQPGIDPQVKMEIEQHVFSLIEKFVATMQGGTGSATDTLDDDLDPTNYDGVMLASSDIELDAWLNLIDVAIAIRDLAPWRWLTDSQLIGVRDPETGEVWYCSIMGMLGEYFAVMAYPGEKGLTMLQASSARDEQPAMHHLLTISGISVDFDDEEYLEPPDFLLFGKLNKCFMGSMAWPKFRDYTAGYFPWFLNANQVTLFTLILSQVFALAKQSKESASMIPDINIMGKIFMHEPTRDANDKIEWQDRVITAPVTKLVKNRYPFLLLNATKDTKPALTTEMETCLDRIQRSRKPRQAIVDVEIVQTEMHCQDSTSRPYFPVVMICIDETTANVHDARLLKPDTPASAILLEFISLLEKLEFVPEIIHVLSRPTLTVLTPITTALGLKLVQKIHLRTLENVIVDLLQSFREND